MTKKDPRDLLPQEALTAVTKGENGEWHFAEHPSHQVVMSKFLDGMKPGVTLVVVPPRIVE